MRRRNHYSVCNIDIRRRDLLALLARLLDLLHRPDAQRRPPELRPDLRPPLVLVRLLPIWLSFEAAHEGPGEVDLVRMCDG